MAGGRVIEVVGSEPRPPNGCRPGPTWRRVLRAVVKRTGISAETLRGRKRDHEICRARQACVLVARDVLDMSLRAIGDELGGRDHSTISYSHQRAQLYDDRGWAELISHVREDIERDPPEWRVEIVDPDPEGALEDLDGFPGLRVVYRRLDGTEWVGLVSMRRRLPVGA